MQLLPDGPLPWLARSLEGTDAVNLLQGEFARATDFGARLRAMAHPGLAGGGLLAVHVAAQAVQIHQAKHEAAALDEQIASVFSSAMPAEPMQGPAPPDADRASTESTNQAGARNIFCVL